MTPSEFEFLKNFLKTRSGLVLSNDKQYLVESRLLPIARSSKLETLSAVIQQLQRGTNRALETDVVEAMTTNESFFFRDKTPFEHFKDTMLPALLESRATRKQIKIWCAAASTGQEPYSLGICLKEDAAKMAGWRTRILGTDLSNEVLEKAKTGLYSQFEVQRGLPIQMLLKYFEQKGDMWQINAGMRAMIEWKKLNLLESFTHLGEFDIIFCRNVLIYFDQATKTEILGRLAKSLPDDGYLVLGAAETVVGLTDAFKPVPGKRGLFQKKQAAQAATGTAATPRLAVGAGAGLGLQR
ncbi:MULTISPECIES: CheR family methyltransferase [Stappiaceae]|jgi:chemotaxis protein methyltransferase CheR|uniref:protein-glutamate O-methyltransferase n=2 Tax=Roseibium TaxID=150830 RepID=A0A0M6YBT3_9HYPH|nr:MULTISPECIES: protein-glutamate O-methyltransferase CheR [Stappiaceae]MCR9284172.1 protein-glutamate O-methyltransferase CheR [Paracoccaceae bacterium]MEC9420791.1 protein-glutamate O-methyltransferase CheR [Pseudomonadota bacterium]AMN51891.1 chemotaxis protein CheR [Labrenzia sp. CP4]AQQ04976.1 chemotaxis protein CheR [Roseibium aggregatum]ERP85925.1 chemotaxis protein CheR [Labrenzia sp. C1B10]